MSFDYTPTKPTSEQQYTSTSGFTPTTWQMFGKDGAGVAGKSKWIPITGVQWKTFVLRQHASPFSTALGAASVEIHVANELDDVDADANTKFKTLATLNAAGPFLESEPPYRFVRAELKVAGTAAVQIDFNGIAV